jgi:lipopolysaccharide biosynthesis protein
MSGLLAERFDIPFQLVLTCDSVGIDLTIPNTPHLVNVHRIVVENRGRDIRPFLDAVRHTPNFEIGLKLHTKKSPQRLDGMQWRAALLDSLLPPTGVGPLVTKLWTDSRIGMAAPAEFCLSVAPWVLQNEPGMVKIAAALGSELVETDLDNAFFAAGSMFWFRRRAIEALSTKAILDLFEPEQGQLDGTIAHAMERMFPVEAKRQGLLSLAVPALMASHPDSPAETLQDLARQYADIPTRYFPGPGIQEGTPPLRATSSVAWPGWLRTLVRPRGS